MNTIEKGKIGNVLVIGNSGVGKSTLINAVLGEDLIETKFGTEGTTKELRLYKSNDESVPFQLIDTVGFEPSTIKRFQAIHAVRKWSSECAKKGNENNQINVIWFCVDGTSAKLFDQTVNNLLSATTMWKSVPIIVVITKSYSIPDREKNLKMVEEAFSKKNVKKKPRMIIPVVAETFTINDDAFAPPDGITELIDTTNQLMPEGIKAADHDLKQFILNRKRAMAQGVTSVSTVSAAVVGFAPIVAFSDALILAPIETAEIKAIAEVYGLRKNTKSKQFIDTIVNTGAVSLVAKSAIGALKAIPGINIVGAPLNAAVAGGIVVALGEGATYAFEQVYLGKKTLDDLDWVKKLMESKLSNTVVSILTEAVKKMSNDSDAKAVAKAILSVLKKQK